MDRLGSVADWRNAEAYAPLLDADRTIIAWEWLRRNPDYRRAAIAALRGKGNNSAGAERWGLCNFEHPGLAAPNARPLWSRKALPAVLEAVAVAQGLAEDRFDPSRLSGLVSLTYGTNGVEHVLLSDGLRAIRLDLLIGTIAAGPVRLEYRLTGIISAQAPLLTLRRLLAANATGRFGRSLHPEETRARRWVLMLRAHDGLSEGADLRQIAAMLLSARAKEARWRVNAPYLRSRVQRLVRNAIFMASEGYRALLNS